MNLFNTKMEVLSEKHIFASNLLNESSIEILNHIIPQLEKYKGKNIYTAKGDLSEKYKVSKISINKLGLGDWNKCDISYYMSRSISHLWLEVKICLRNGSFVHYDKKEIYLGRLENEQKLIELDSFDKICEVYELRKQYHIDEINEKIKAYNKAIDKAEELKTFVPFQFRQK